MIHLLHKPHRTLVRNKFIYFCMTTYGIATAILLINERTHQDEKTIFWQKKKIQSIVYVFWK